MIVNTSIRPEDDDDEEFFVPSTILTSLPANDLPSKHYSLDPDLASGWVPKLKVVGPIPLNFDNKLTDVLVKTVLQEHKIMQYSVVYLGRRPASTFKIHEQLPNKNYHYKYEHLYLNNYAHLQPFFKKFYSEFQPQTLLSFKGMNPEFRNQSQLIFDSDFEGGNLDAVIKVKSGEYDLFIRIDSNTRGHMQWYYFKIKNVSLRKVKLNIVNFKKNKTLYERGMKPFLRINGGKWAQGGSNIQFKDATLRYQFLEQHFSVRRMTMKQLSFEHEFNSASEEVEFCYCVPYGYSRVIQLCRQLVSYEHCKYSVLCESLSGLDLPLLTITNPEVPDNTKKCVFLIARQHPGESNGSFVMEGFLKWVTGDSQEAQVFRNQVVIKAVPMLNPDGVIIGNYRTSFCGKDLNRLFKAKTPIMFPQVQGLKIQIQKLKEEFKSRLLVFLDLHGHSVRKGVFTYGPGFALSQSNYYKSRILPKLISQITNMFRYYSCSFRISSAKLLTARAHISKVVPFCYTMESSNWAYYDSERREDIPFAEKDWLIMGQRLGQGAARFIKMYLEDQRENRERKKRRLMQDTDTGNRTLRNPPYKYANNSKSLSSKPNNFAEQEEEKQFKTTIVRKSIKNLQKPTKLMEEIRQIQEETKQSAKPPEDQAHESDEFNSQGADSSSSSQDLDGFSLNKLYNAATNIMLEFENCFYKRNSFEAPKSSKNSRKKTETKKKNKAVISTQGPEIEVMACLKNKIRQSIERMNAAQMIDPLLKRPSLKKKLEGSSKYLNPVVHQELESSLLKPSRDNNLVIHKMNSYKTPKSITDSGRAKALSSNKERAEFLIKDPGMEFHLMKNNIVMKEAGFNHIRIRNFSSLKY